MQCQVVKIGTSKGIRIPAKMLKSIGEPDSFELTQAPDDRLILTPIKRKPRKGWSEAYAAMHENGDDHLLIDDALDIQEFGE